MSILRRIAPPGRRRRDAHRRHPHRLPQHGLGRADRPGLERVDAQQQRANQQRGLPGGRGRPGRLPVEARRRQDATTSTTSIQPSRRAGRRRERTSTHCRTAPPVTPRKRAPSASTGPAPRSGIRASPSGKDNWCQLANGYEYNLQITPPTATNENIQIVSDRPEDLHARVLDLELVRPWHQHHPVARRAGMGALVAAVRLPDDHELRLQRRVDCDDERQDLRRARLERQQPRHRSRGHRHGQSLRRRDDHRDLPACRTEPRNTPARRFARSSRRRSTSATSPHPSTTSRRRRSLGASTSTPASPIWKFVLLANGTFTAQGCTRTGR